MTEKLLTGMLSLNTNKQNYFYAAPDITVYGALDTTFLGLILTLLSVELLMLLSLVLLTLLPPKIHFKKSMTWDA